MEEYRGAWQNPVFSLSGEAHPHRPAEATKLNSELAPLVKFSEFASLISDSPYKQLKLKDKLNFIR